MPLLLSAAGGVEVPAVSEGFSVSGPSVITSFDLFGVTFNLTESIIAQWFVILLTTTIFLILRHNLKVVPTTRRQIFAEWVVSFFKDSVEENMGPKYSKYVYYIGGLFCLSMFSSLSGLLGFRPPTADLSVLLSWCLITFVLVTRNKFKTGGIKGWLKSFPDPIPFMLPFNIVGEFANPISQAFRHFGNILGGFVIGGLVQHALGGIVFGIFRIGVPAALSLYLDLFSAVVQAYIFTLLTMAYVSMAECGGD